MATLITKNSSTAAAVPGTGDIVQGELAVNVADKRLFTKDAGGTVVEVGTNPSSLVVDGNVGIGTSSPTTKLDVSSSGTTTLRVNRLGTADVYLTAGANGIYGLDTASTNLHFGVSNSLKMTLDSSGNLGLGVTPSAWSVRAFQLTGSPAISSVNGIDITYNAFYDGAWKYVGTARALHYSQVASSGEHRWFTAPSGTAGAAISFTQAMTLDAGGNLLVGTTGQYSGYAARQTISYTGSTSLYGLTLNAESTSNTTAIVFNVGGTNAGSGGTVVGTITNTSTATAYNTSSDYRLKNNPQTLVGSGAFIDALEPKTWDWVADGSRGVGFIAHEVQAVSPNSVVGEKDAVDEDGKPVMQAMEYGSAEFIANIIAELQSLRARVAALETP